MIHLIYKINGFSFNTVHWYGFKFYLHLTFKKLPLVQFWYSIKEEYLQFFDNAIKTLLIFLITYLCKYRFPSYISIRRTEHNRSNAEADIRYNK